MESNLKLQWHLLFSILSSPGARSVNGTALQSRTKGRTGLVSPLWRRRLRESGCTGFRSPSCLRPSVSLCWQGQKASSGGSWGRWRRPASQRVHRAAAVWPSAALSLEKCRDVQTSRPWDDEHIFLESIHSNIQENAVTFPPAAHWVQRCWPHPPPGTPPSIGLWGCS